ncbi:MAG: DUF4826 family protein [Candidatus Hydrogenedentes bacterium]|nr:DUF4826 family protein [Candidatus Hydrogenedentota bacterium]
MSSLDYDDPAVEEKWCNECRARVADYLKGQGVTHGRIGEWPAWHIAPYVSIWAIESVKYPESVGWWAICGDVPTDYVSAATIKHPRDAMRALAESWFEVSDYMMRGEKHPTITMGTPQSWPEVGPLLKARAEILTEWANDESLWEDEVP